MLRLFYYSLTLLMLGQANLFAQIGMGGKPHPSAVLDLQSPTNDKVFYPPRLTTAQRLTVVNPQAGALVYDLDKGTLYLNDGQNWLPLLTTDPRLLAPISRTASDAAGNDNFGFSVAISGDYALVGASTKTIGNNQSQGAVYVFIRSGSSWMQQQRLLVSDGSNSVTFGARVALSGDYALVRAQTKIAGSNTYEGAVYVFVRSGTTWTQQQRLLASDGAVEDQFGTSIAISGEYALVGAYTKTIGSATYQGAAYLFMRSGATWTQQQRLVASDGVAYEGFGSSVALSDNYALIGAVYKPIGSNDSQGAAYVFVRSGSNWTQQQRLVANDGAPNDLFGSSVSLSGDYALVGAPAKKIGNNDSQGAAYVFIRSASSWTQQRLVASDGMAGDHFGSSVAISGEYALVGASNKTVGTNTQQGAAYLYMRVGGGSWLTQQEIIDNSPINTSNGYSVGLSNGTYIIGGPNYKNNQGKVSFGTVN